MTLLPCETRVRHRLTGREGVVILAAFLPADEAAWVQFDGDLAASLCLIESLILPRVLPSSQAA